MQLRIWRALLQNLDALRASASAQSIQDFGYPFMSDSGRRGYEIELRNRMELDTSKPPVRTKTEFKARLAMMGIKLVEREE